MVINTSYLAIDAENPHAVLVSCTCPNWYKGRWIKVLGPDWSTLQRYKQNHDEESYTKEYIAKLDSLGEKTVLSLLHDGDILLCYEATGKFCHRHLLANWLREHGVTIGKEL